MPNHRPAFPSSHRFASRGAAPADFINFGAPQVKPDASFNFINFTSRGAA